MVKFVKRKSKKMRKPRLIELSLVKLLKSLILPKKTWIVLRKKCVCIILSKVNIV